VEVREVGPNTPLCGVIRKVLEQHKAAVTCEELAIAVREYWGRSFPQNPYEDPCLIYKLAGIYLDVEYNFDEVGDIPLVFRRNSGDGEELSPKMGPTDLNRIADQVKRVKVNLKAR
jgi:hypothetical protein